MIRTFKTTVLAATATLCLGAPSALAQDAPDPRAIADRLVDEWEGLESFEAFMTARATGMLAMQLKPFEGEVVFGRSPAHWRFKASGTIDGAQGLGDGRVDLSRDTLGKFVWLDHQTLQRLESPKLPGILGPYRVYFMSEYVFEFDSITEFASGNLTHKGTAEVGGELCDILESRVSDNDRRQFFIARSDGLPRRMIGIVPIAGTFDITFENLDVIDNADASDFVLNIPEGYTEPGNIGRPNRLDPDRQVFLQNPPNWQLPTGTGGQVALDELEDKAVLLNFFGTWSGPSREAIPMVEDIAQVFARQHGDGVKVFGLAVRERDGGAPIRYFEENNLSYDLLLEADDVARDYKITTFPSFVILGRDGRIVDIIQGYDEDLTKERVLNAMTRAIIRQQRRE
ncbi:MAG: TlpA disulfide reductase family protein [Planctomycetota bacterium]